IGIHYAVYLLGASPFLKDMGPLEDIRCSCVFLRFENNNNKIMREFDIRDFAAEANSQNTLLKHFESSLSCNDAVSMRSVGYADIMSGAVQLYLPCTEDW
ncbi:hypothetical protein OS493_028241, partial [Desmophyllum pertusum]